MGEKGEGGVWWVRRERGSVVGEKGEEGVWWVRRERRECGG